MNEQELIGISNQEAELIERYWDEIQQQFEQDE